MLESSSHPVHLPGLRVDGALELHCLTLLLQRLMPLAETQLRPATSDDASEVARLLTDARAAFMPYAPGAHTEAEVRAWVAETLVPGGGVTVAVQAERVLAAMATRCDAGLSWIEQMAVDPPCVNRGLGSRLLVQALHDLPGPIRLYTFQANTGARRFYERHGFTAIRWTDGRDNEEHCPDVLYEHAGLPSPER